MQLDKFNVWRRKRKALEIMTTHIEDINGLDVLGQTEALSEDTVEGCLKFVGLLYGENTPRLNTLKYALNQLLIN